MYNVESKELQKKENGNEDGRRAGSQMKGEKRRKELSQNVEKKKKKEIIKK